MIGIVKRTTWGWKYNIPFNEKLEHIISSSDEWEGEMGWRTKQLVWGKRRGEGWRYTQSADNTNYKQTYYVICCHCHTSDVRELRFSSVSTHTHIQPLHIWIRCVPSILQSHCTAHISPFIGIVLIKFLFIERKQGMNLLWLHFIYVYDDDDDCVLLNSIHFPPAFESVSPCFIYVIPTFFILILILTTIASARNITAGLDKANRVITPIPTWS